MNGSYLLEALCRYEKEQSDLHYKRVLLALCGSFVWIHTADSAGERFLLSDGVDAFLPVFLTERHLCEFLPGRQGECLPFLEVLRIAEKNATPLSGIALEPSGNVFVLPREAFAYVWSLAAQGLPQDSSS